MESEGGGSEGTGCEAVTEKNGGHFVLYLWVPNLGLWLSGHRQSLEPQSGHQRDVSGADDRLSGRLVRSAPCLLSCGGAGAGLCGGGDGAVFVRNHAAGFEGGRAAE